MMACIKDPKCLVAANVKPPCPQPPLRELAGRDCVRACHKAHRYARLAGLGDDRKLLGRPSSADCLAVLVDETECVSGSAGPCGRRVFGQKMEDRMASCELTEPVRKTQKKRFFGSPGKTLAILAGVAFLVWARISYTPPPPKPEEEAKAQNDRFRSKRAADVAKEDRDRSLCRTALICRHFGEAKQACAVAGDFNSCVRVKVGDKDMGATSLCTSDGSVADEPTDMPNRLRCAEFDLGG